MAIRSPDSTASMNRLSILAASSTVAWDVERRTAATTSILDRDDVEEADSTNLAMACGR
ncbi:MAG TPA: hypothetical protein VII76_01590 [Acidimicrobiales bacterium]